MERAVMEILKRETIKINKITKNNGFVVLFVSAYFVFSLCHSVSLPIIVPKM